MTTGRIVVLNGAPRSGKTSLAAALQAADPASSWRNVGVDTWPPFLPEALAPGLGLRPGGERPDLEPHVERLFLGLYDTVAAQARAGGHVVVDVGHHDDFSRPLGLLPRCAARLAGLPTWFVGVRCPLDVVLDRREIDLRANGVEYLGREPSGAVPDPVQRWQDAVHRPGIYDLELDTSQLTPDAAAARLLDHLAHGPTPTARTRLAARSTT